MGKIKDITNQRFGKLVALEMVGLNKQGAIWKCACDCGAQCIVNGANLRSGNSTSCGCNRVDTLSNRYDNLLNKRFGRLLVTEKMPSNKFHQVQWKCRCDCGKECVVVGNSLKSGLTTSCGCFHSEVVSQLETIDLVGKSFGRLKVVERVTPIGDLHVKYKCLCECGNEVIVRSNSLLKTVSPTRSCGCYQRDVLIAMNQKDISGNRYGKLVAIERVGVKNHKSIWKCRCDCGNECVVCLSSLVQGNTESCGCIQSRGENIIENILKKNKIDYIKQKKFLGCFDNKQLPFDFYIPSRNIAIEYDGIFHYEVINKINNDLEGQQRRDAIKTKYCEENDIVLLRIPYWDKDNIESILMDWLFLNGEAGETDERQRDYGEGR